MKYAYSPKTFLRDVPKEMLKEYFAAKEVPGDPPTRGVLQDFDWDTIDGTSIDPLYDAWQDLDEATAASIESDFRAIHDLANENGIRVIIEEGHDRHHNVDLGPELDARDGLLHKATWVFVHYRNIFEIARIFFTADQFSGHYVRRRDDLPLKPPDISEEACTEYTKAISAYYLKKEGRGKLCQMDLYLRGGHRHYFYVHPQDYGGTFMEFTAKGEFTRRPQKPAFEVVFIFDEKTGVLDVCARADARTKQALQKLFGKHVMHIALGPEDRSRTPFDLSALKDANFEVRGLAQHGIVSFTITSLRVAVPGIAPLVGFGPMAGAGPHEIQHAMQKALRADIAMDRVTVRHATFRVEFPPVNDRAVKVDFGISSRGWSLKGESAEEQAIKECLKLSGIVRE